MRRIDPWLLYYSPCEEELANGGYIKIYNNLSLLRGGSDD